METNKEPWQIQYKWESTWYIREKYPNYKVTSSTCKRITDLETLNDETAKKYDIVVMDYDFNNKFDILEKVQNKEKCEILVNYFALFLCNLPFCSAKNVEEKNVAGKHKNILISSQQAVAKNEELWYTMKIEYDKMPKES